MSSYKTKKDLPQGGLELLCVCTFTGVSAQVKKVKKLLTDHATIPEAKIQQILIVMMRLI